MTIVSKLTEDEMIYSYIKAEYYSQRFGRKLKEVLSTIDESESIVFTPNLQDKSENRKRKMLLKEYRNYTKNEGLFENFPSDIVWYLVSITHTELCQIKYINYSFWNTLTNNTRIALNGVDKIRSNEKIYNMGLDSFLSLENEIKNGKKFEPIIAVAKNNSSDIVVLEGHSRLTGYVLANCLKKYEIILGFSENIEKWSLY